MVPSLGRAVSAECTGDHRRIQAVHTEVNRGAVSALSDWARSCKYTTDLFCQCVLKVLCVYQCQCKNLISISFLLFSSSHINLLLVHDKNQNGIKSICTNEENFMFSAFFSPLNIDVILYVANSVYQQRKLVRAFGRFCCIHTHIHVCVFIDWLCTCRLNNY